MFNFIESCSREININTFQQQYRSEQPISTIVISSSIRTRHHVTSYCNAYRTVLTARNGMKHCTQERRPLTCNNRNTKFIIIS